MSGIFKSRLFNFLNRQKIRFTNQLGITLRHLQLATETGVKILLYPVYIIVRTSISIRHRLKSQAASSTEFELTTESDSQSSATEIKLARSLAPEGPLVKISREKTSAEDDLWLEFEDNNLAIDTSKTDALATLADSQQVTSGLSLQRQNNSQVNPPIRFFQKMLDWVKTSPIATRLNLFGEASIVSSSPSKSLTAASSSSLNSSLSVNQTVSQPEKNSFFSNLLDRLGLRSSNRSKLTNSPHSNILTTESSEQESFAIQVLIRRAISYFFGNKQQLLSGQNQKVLPSTESQVNLPVVNYSESRESKFSLLSRVNSWLGKVKSAISRPHSLTKESSEQESLAIQVLIRRAIAYFFSNKQKLLSSKNQAVLPSAESQESATIQLSQANLPVVKSSQSQESKSSLLSPIKSWLEKVKSTISRSHSLTTESSEQESLAIQVLIRRALTHFLGRKQRLLSGKNQAFLPSAESQEATKIHLSQVKLTRSQTCPAPYSGLNRTEVLGFVYGAGSLVNSWSYQAKSTSFRSESSTTASLVAEPLTIQTLIKKVIAYFFGKKQVGVSNNLNGRSFGSLPLSTFSLPVESNPLSFTLPFNLCNLKLLGFTEQDFCLPENLLTQNNSLSIIEPDLPELETTSIHMDWGKLLPMNNFSAEINQNPSCLVVTANFPSTSTREQESLTVTYDSNDSLFAKIPLEFSSDLWEAEVVTVGYVKNLLERILEVLDKITWWIERQFLKLWQFFKKILSM